MSLKSFSSPSTLKLISPCPHKEYAYNSDLLTCF